MQFASSCPPCSAYSPYVFGFCLPRKKQNARMCLPHLPPNKKLINRVFILFLIIQASWFGNFKKMRMMKITIRSGYLAV